MPRSKQKEIVKKRTSWFRRWADHAIALMDEERKVPASLPASLWQVHPDQGIVDDMIPGFELVGEATGGGILLQPATLPSTT